MKRFDNVVIDDYIKQYYYLRLSEIRLVGNTINENSVMIISDQYNSAIFMKEFLDEVMLIFAIDEKDLIVKHIYEWFGYEFNNIKLNFDSVIRDINYYFNSELTITLGPRSWDVKTKEGKDISLDEVSKYFRDSGVNFIDKKIMSRLYNLWFDDEIIKISSKMMNF